MYLSARRCALLCGVVYTCVRVCVCACSHAHANAATRLTVSVSGGAMLEAGNVNANVACTGHALSVGVACSRRRAL